MTERAGPDKCQSEDASRPLRVMWIWHAAVVAEYQKPLSALAAFPGIDATLLVPRRWPERAGQMVEAEEPSISNFRLIKARAAFTGFYYIYFFPALLYYLLKCRPDVIYCYEEAHTLMAALTLVLRRLFLPRSKVILYAAQNVRKRYPLPFRLFERYSFAHADLILACGKTVARTLRSKGYRGDLRVVPLPVDACAFCPDPGLRSRGRHMLGLDGGSTLVGYAGKLVEEKGLCTLWAAFEPMARERSDLHLVLAGGGPLAEKLRNAARSAGLEDRVHLPGVIHNADLPLFLSALDLFVLPSETRSNWREQFGRAIVEAMSCGVPVIGSDSGEIPEVVAGAGLVFHEGDAKALRDCLQAALADPHLRNQLSHLGRERVLRLFSVDKVAAEHYSIYREMSAAR